MLKYFFNDVIEKVNAPQGFVTKLMVELDSTLYDVGDTIVREGDIVSNLIFVISGSCVLNGIHETKKRDHKQLAQLKN